MRAMIVIGLAAYDGTSSTHAPLKEKLEILKRCYASARNEGLPITVIAAAEENTGAIEEVRRAVPGVPLWAVWGRYDKQRGEAAIGAKAAWAAERDGCAWIIKIAGDTFHPAPGWARRWLDIAKSTGADIVSTMHHRPDWITSQCFAASVAAMKKSWPGPDSDFSRIGIESVWADRIRAHNLKWHVIPSRLISVDGTSNHVPSDPSMTYLHAHMMSSTAEWKRVVPETVVPDPSINISIGIPARNETTVDPEVGPLLSGTVRSIEETSAGMPLPEIIGVDDGSIRPMDWGAYGGRLRVLKNIEPLGVDPSRNIAIAAATGDVVGILDGHMRVQNQKREPCMHGIQKLATLAMQKNALVVGQCMHLELPPNAVYPPMCGGSFVPIRDNPDQQLAISWAHFYPPDGINRVTSLFGAQYFAPRALWQRIGGFVNDCRCWGYSEEGVSLKAAFMGIPIYCLGEVTISHWFRARGPHVFPVDPWHKAVNRAKILRVTFSDRIFKDFWLPRLKRAKPPFVFDDRMQQAMDSHSILSEHHRFQAVKIKTDEEVLREIFEVPI